MEEFIAKLMEQAPKYILIFGGAIAVVIIGFWVTNRIALIIKRLLIKNKVDSDVIPFILTTTRVLLKSLILFSAAGIVGIETASFIAILASIGFAIGIALQGSLGHLAAGILILALKPFKTGDTITVEGHTGDVEEIGMFNTSIVTLDNRKIIVPNGSLSNGVIQNLSVKGARRVDITVGISYNEDIDNARQVIQKIVNSCPHAVRNKQHEIVVTELADSSVNFSIRFWTQQKYYWKVYFYLHEYIKKELDKDNVEIPYPKMDVYLNQVAST